MLALYEIGRGGCGGEEKRADDGEEENAAGGEAREDTKLHFLRCVPPNSSGATSLLFSLNRPPTPIYLFFLLLSFFVHVSLSCINDLFLSISQPFPCEFGWATAMCWSGPEPANLS